jgi:hypothetical protein
MITTTSLCLLVLGAFRRIAAAEVGSEIDGIPLCMVLMYCFKLGCESETFSLACNDFILASRLHDLLDYRFACEVRVPF